MTTREIIQCDHCREEIDISKPYVEVVLRQIRLPNVAELVSMGVVPDGIAEEDAIKLRDERFSTGGLSMIRDEKLLHFCDPGHFSQYNSS
jgi:hypothetical protein